MLKDKKTAIGIGLAGETVGLEFQIRNYTSYLMNGSTQDNQTLTGAKNVMVLEGYDGLAGDRSLALEALKTVSYTHLDVYKRQKYGKISVDIMENVENNFTEARTSGELARAYEDAIRGVPDSLGVEIDQMAREKAQELAKKSKYAKFESERQALYDIMDASVSNAMKRTVSLNQKREVVQNESVSEQELSLIHI